MNKANVKSVAMFDLKFDVGTGGAVLDAEIRDGVLTLTVSAPALDLGAPAQHLKECLMSGMSERKAVKMVDRMFGRIAREMALSVLTKAAR
jgi:ATP-dependent helicase YprA (DUF1998 family)